MLHAADAAGCSQHLVVHHGRHSLLTVREGQVGNCRLDHTGRVLDAHLLRLVHGKNHFRECFVRYI